MKTEMDWACGFVGDERGAYRVVDGKLRKTNTLGDKHISAIRILK